MNRQESGCDSRSYWPGIPAKTPPPPACAMYVRERPHSGPPPDVQARSPIRQRAPACDGDASLPEHMAFLRKPLFPPFCRASWSRRGGSKALRDRSGCGNLLGRCVWSDRHEGAGANAGVGMRCPRRTSEGERERTNWGALLPRPFGAPFLCATTMFSPKRRHSASPCSLVITSYPLCGPCLCTTAVEPPLVQPAYFYLRDSPLPCPANTRWSADSGASGPTRRPDQLTTR
ncbi:hypothetical protein VUR80DRAFT_8176 [Thermomyces stellatus]